mgnify:CR=1 FL=1
MNETVKYVLINIAVAFAISLFFLITGQSDGISSFFLAYGTISLLGFVINGFIGIILLLAGSKEKGKKMILAAGVLLVVGAATCSIGFGELNFH